MKAKSCIFIVAVLFSGVSYGEIYKWTDENGKQHFSNVKPNSVDAVQQAKVREGSFVEQDQAQLQRSKEYVERREAEREQARKAKPSFPRRSGTPLQSSASVEEDQRQLQEARKVMRDSPLRARRAKNAP